MSRYAPLWEYVKNAGKDSLTLAFAEIAGVTGFPIDHSFLQYKKELLSFGYEVLKISVKNETVLFTKTK